MSSTKTGKKTKPSAAALDLMSVRIEPTLHRELDSFVEARRHRGLSKQDAVQEAIRSYLNPQDETPAIFRALNRIDNHVHTANKRLDMLGQLFLHYIRYYFLLWPDMTKEETTERQIRSNEMFGKYLRSLKRRVDKQDLYQILDPDQIDAMMQEITETIQDLITEKTERHGKDLPV